MHLEEKTFLKKMAMMSNNENTTAAAPISQRQHGGSSRKRQDLSLNAKGFTNVRGINNVIRPGES